MRYRPHGARARRLRIPGGHGLSGGRRQWSVRGRMRCLGLIWGFLCGSKGASSVVTELGVNMIVYRCERHNHTTKECLCVLYFTHTVRRVHQVEHGTAPEATAVARAILPVHYCLHPLYERPGTVVYFTRVLRKTVSVESGVRI